MSAETVGFAIAEEDQATLQALVDHFGRGNRSEFLRAAMKRMTHDMWAEKMRGLQDQARVTRRRIASRSPSLATIFGTIFRHTSSVI